MTKYKLSPHIVLTPIADIKGDNIPHHFTEGYNLYDEIKNRDYFINPTIKYFLDKFSSSTTLVTVIEEIKTDLKSDHADIDDICQSFFDFLAGRKILVEETFVQLILSRESFFATGDSIDSLVIEEILSLRSNIDIYKAYDSATGGRCVIKLLNRKKMKDEYAYTVALAEMEREYLLLKRTEDIAGIYQPLGLKKNDAFAYMTLEFVPGKSLSKYLKEVHELSLKDALQIIEEILMPFSSLHNHKIIHGDIHSSNILISENKVVKIIDLGFSRIVEIEKDELLKFGGVTFYMPPERINITSIKKYIHAPDLFSDVYQIGLLMYLTLYNTLPFDGFIWEELAQNIKESTPAFPENSYSDYIVPLWLIAIVQRCLSKEPDKRYESASEILKDFKPHFFAGQEIATN